MTMTLERACEILGVDKSADKNAVKAAYRSKARELHPDKVGKGSTSDFQDLQNAYEVLNDHLDSLNSDTSIPHFTPVPTSPPPTEAIDPIDIFLKKITKKMMDELGDFYVLSQLQHVTPENRHRFGNSRIQIMLLENLITIENVASMSAGFLYYIDVNRSDAFELLLKKKIISDFSCLDLFTIQSLMHALPLKLIKNNILKEKFVKNNWVGIKRIIQTLEQAVKDDPSLEEKLLRPDGEERFLTKPHLPPDYKIDFKNLSQFQSLYEHAEDGRFYDYYDLLRKGKNPLFPDGLPHCIYETLSTNYSLMDNCHGRNIIFEIYIATIYLHLDSLYYILGNKKILELQEKYFASNSYFPKENNSEFMKRGLQGDKSAGHSAIYREICGILDVSPEDLSSTEYNKNLSKIDSPDKLKRAIMHFKHAGRTGKLTLTDINLDNADICSMDLSNTVFNGVSLKYTRISNVNFLGADLRGAVLTGATFFHLIFDEKTQFPEDLRDVTLCQDMFEMLIRYGRKNFRGVDLSGMNLSGLTLKNCDFQDATLSGFVNVTLEGCDLRGVDLEDVDLSTTWLTNCDLRGAKLRKTIFNEDHLIENNLDNAEFSEGDDLFDLCMSQPSVLTSNRPLVSHLLAHFEKIYQALREGQTAWFWKSNYLSHLAMFHTDAEKFQAIISHIKKLGYTRSRIALKLACKYIDLDSHQLVNSEKSEALFKEIYQESFSRSMLGSHSNLTGSLFWTSNKLNTALNTAHINLKTLDKVHPEKRSEKIYHALKLGSRF